jgi:hypothetical protein
MIFTEAALGFVGGGIWPPPACWREDGSRRELTGINLNWPTPTVLPGRRHRLGDDWPHFLTVGLPI